LTPAPSQWPSHRSLEYSQPRELVGPPLWEDPGCRWKLDALGVPRCRRRGASAGRTRRRRARGARSAPAWRPTAAAAAPDPAPPRAAAPASPRAAAPAPPRAPAAAPAPPRAPAPAPPRASASAPAPAPPPQPAPAELEGLIVADATLPRSQRKPPRRGRPSCAGSNPAAASRSLPVRPSFAGRNTRLGGSIAVAPRENSPCNTSVPARSDGRPSPPCHRYHTRSIVLRSPSFPPPTNLSTGAPDRRTIRLNRPLFPRGVLRSPGGSWLDGCPWALSLCRLVQRR